jgi:penicillin-binding protein-related factor A (putative recombinase)
MRSRRWDWGASKLRGSDFESTIGWVNQMYANQDIAYIEKVEVPKMTVGGKTRYTAKTGFDYSGVIVGSGRMVCIEAKESKEKLHIDFRGKQGLRIHQLHALIKYGHAGCYAGLVWHHREEKKTFFLDYKFLENFMKTKFDKKENGKGHVVKSIRLRHVECICPCICEDGELPDYLMRLENQKQLFLGISKTEGITT